MLLILFRCVLKPLLAQDLASFILSRSSFEKPICEYIYIYAQQGIYISKIEDTASRISEEGVGNILLQVSKRQATATSKKLALNPFSKVTTGNIKLVRREHQGFMVI